MVVDDGLLGRRPWKLWVTDQADGFGTILTLRLSAKWKSAPRAPGRRLQDLKIRRCRSYAGAPPRNRTGSF